MDIFNSIFSAGISLTGQISLTLAFIYEDATKLAVLKTTDVLFACLLQYILLGVVIDYLAVIGSCSILMSTFTILSFRFFQERYESYKVAEAIDSVNGSPKKSCCLDFIFVKI